MENRRMRPSTNTNLELKKGAWTVEEDMLLKNCIEKFGEGKWHLVPPRSGLHRCRKSCRLRWLNYLRPNIKRGDFEDDEIDLMLRLHKLLGNRWSLIAGRLPGRTANDVKNYWNTHLKPRPKQQKERLKESEPSKHTMVTIIKPKARTTSKAFNLSQNIRDETFNMITSSNINISAATPEVVSLPTLRAKKIDEYFGELFCDEDKEIDDRGGWSFGGFSADGNSLDIGKQVDNNLYDFSIDEMDMLDLLD